MEIFRISGVWHVGWWNLITSVRLIQVGNNRNDHFRYFLGVRLIKVSFKVNKGNKFGDFGYCPLNRGCPLNTGFTVVRFNTFKFRPWENEHTRAEMKCVPARNSTGSPSSK